MRSGLSVCLAVLLLWAVPGCGEDAGGGLGGSYLCQGPQVSAPCEPQCASPAGLTWVTVPEGAFTMGCVPGDFWCEADEKPAHEVQLCQFELTATEVTQAQYAAVFGATPEGNSGCPDCPVGFVIKAEAQAFCAAVGGRLPTEAEWEYAARAGAETVYPCGDDYECLPPLAWFVENSGGATHPVGTLQANAFGLYDMVGNVSEFVEDCFRASYRGASGAGHQAVVDACDAQGLLRGGHFVSIFNRLRLSDRLELTDQKRYSNAGFRCARQSFQPTWEAD